MRGDRRRAEQDPRRGVLPRNGENVPLPHLPVPAMQVRQISLQAEASHDQRGSPMRKHDGAQRLRSGSLMASIRLLIGRYAGSTPVRSTAADARFELARAGDPDLLLRRAPWAARQICPGASPGSGPGVGGLHVLGLAGWRGGGRGGYGGGGGRERSGGDEGDGGVPPEFPAHSVSFRSRSVLTRTVPTQSHPVNRRLMRAPVAQRIEQPASNG